MITLPSAHRKVCGSSSSIIFERNSATLQLCNSKPKLMYKSLQTEEKYVYLILFLVNCPFRRPYNALLVIFWWFPKSQKRFVNSIFPHWVVRLCSDFYWKQLRDSNNRQRSENVREHFMCLCFGRRFFSAASLRGNHHVPVWFTLQPARGFQEVFGCAVEKPVVSRLAPTHCWPFLKDTHQQLVQKQTT